MEGHKDKFIELEKIIGSKNPRLLKVLPSFVLNYLKNVIHQDKINDFIDRNGHLRNVDFVEAVFTEFGAIANVKGLEHVPATGGCIIAANHPMGAVDAMGLMKMVGQKRTDMRFFVNDILLNLTNFGELFVGVNKHGKNPKENLRMMDDIFASDNCVLFFPAGLVSRRQNDIVRDLEWQKSFIGKAIQYKKPIIPTYIGGQNSNFFYNLANWRKRLGIKANIEMLYLVDEMYQQKGKTIDYVFGEPIPPSVFSREISQIEWAQKMKDYVYELGNGATYSFSEMNQKSALS
jgi:putative hemolysin